MRGSAELGFLTALKTTFIGIFAYLALTATIAIAVGAIHVAAKTGAAAALVNALFELRKESLESLAVLKDGRGDSAALLGLLGAGMQPASTRWTAITRPCTHPGLLMFAFSLNRYIGRPYDGVVGMLIACGITLATVPLCVGALVWFLGVGYKARAGGGEAMDWNAIHGFSVFVTFFCLTAPAMWLAMMVHRANLVFWLGSPLLGAVLTGIGMLLFAALQPVLVRLTRTPEDGVPAAMLLLILLTGIGYLGGFVAARWEQDEADA